CLEHRHAFRAGGEAERRILDIAAGNDRAVNSLDRGAHLEVRVRGVGVLAGPPRGADEIDVARTLAQPPRAQPAIAAAPALAVWPASLCEPSIEAGAAVGFDAGAAFVEHQIQRI